LSDAQPAPCVDLLAASQAGDGAGPAWTYAGADLNVNLIVLLAPGGVAEHVNAEVEVLLVGVDGAGVVAVEEQALPLRAGQALIVPRGARRAITPSTVRFAYLTCHRRRAGLWPANAPRPGDVS
jgi:mannose-6-phosphate isomerase-like protein (cupin superfamily)